MNLVCLGLIFFVFPQFGVWYASWIYGFNYINLWKLFDHYFFQCNFCPTFSLLSSWSSSCKGVKLFDFLLHFTLLFSLFFFLCAIVWIFFCYVFKSYLSVMSTWVLNPLSEFSLQIFRSSIWFFLFWISFLVCLCFPLSKFIIAITMPCLLTLSSL